MNENKISVSEYLDDQSKLTLTYLPFDTKLQIVSKTVTDLVNTIGGLNTSLLRRISTEVFIESLTNLDLNIQDDNGLKGFDTLMMHNQLDSLKTSLGNEYKELELILSERVNDYIRTETNPAITIEAIYEQIKQYLNIVLDYISEKIQGVDVEQLANELVKITPKELLGGETDEA